MKQNKIKKDDNVAVLWLIARCVAAEAVGLDCFADRRCSAAAWRTDRPAMRAPRPTPLGLRDETAASVIWSQRHLQAAVGRCEWDASPHGCCDGTSKRHPRRCFRRCSSQKSGGNEATKVDHEQQRRGHSAGWRHEHRNEAERFSSELCWRQGGR
ncbi:putative retrotransposon hot spot protein (RHS) [Trypanosoma cruzi]|uniref:Putative retrotransposon hot spot protein (RHS) n=1 Tax=Trypanosoma cruzi TaxID=5693 RepID=A0A2V2W9Z8_TRYCR|nr:putative retrotransposon hot spot protein (RHS) [Trypanosoma cruzi]